MDIQSLRIFGRVARVLSISSVGTEFQLSPGTISKKLMALEIELGIQLFDRTTRSIRLTDEGRLFLEHARDILAATENALAAIDEGFERVRGRLKVSAPKSIGHLDLGSCFASFLAEYPEIEMQVDLSSRYVNLQEEGYDVAIRTGELSDSTLMARRLFDDPQVITAAPNYLAQHGTPLKPKDLEGHSCLVLGDQWRWKFKRKSSLHMARVRGRVRGNDANLLLRCALEGCGIIHTSRAMVEDALSDGRLKELLKDYDTSTEAAVWAVYPNTKHVPPRLRVFIDFVANWLRHRDRERGPVSMNPRPVAKRTGSQANENGQRPKRPRAA